MASATISNRGMALAEKMEERGRKIEDSGSYGGAGLGGKFCMSPAAWRTDTIACDRLPDGHHATRSNGKNWVRRLIMDPGSRFIKNCESKFFNSVCRKRSLKEVEVHNTETQQGQEQRKRARENNDIHSWDNGFCSNPLSPSLTENMLKNSFHTPLSSSDPFSSRTNHQFQEIRRDSTSNFLYVPLECSETVLEILGHLERVAPLKSVEAQLAIARIKPPALLTVSMLNGRARRSIVTVDNIAILDIYD